jgi:hypothetical protein
MLPPLKSPLGLLQMKYPTCWFEATCESIGCIMFFMSIRAIMLGYQANRIDYQRVDSLKSIIVMVIVRYVWVFINNCETRKSGKPVVKSGLTDLQAG